MTTLEQVEKLRERANITYEEAKNVLDSVNGDMLEALVKLENEGKVNPPNSNGVYCSTEQGEKGKEKKKQYYTPPDDDGIRFSQVMAKIGRLLAKIINKGNTNFMEVRRGDKTVLQMPLTVVVILLLVAFWAVIPLMIVGLFFNCRYVFVGKDIEKTPANMAMEKVSETADNFKEELKSDDKEKKDSN